MTTSKTASARLQDLREEWNLDLDGPKAKAHDAHLPKVEAWLRSGTDQPAHLLRAVQVLACSDEPGMARRPCVRQVCSLDGSTVEEFGNGTARVHGAQSLVLAAWDPAFNGSWFRIAPMLLSPWEVIQVRQDAQGAFGQWQQRVREGDLQRVEVSTSAPRVPVKINVTPPSAVAINAGYWQHLEGNVGTTWQFNSFGTQLVHVLAALRTAIDAWPAAFKTQTDAFVDAANKMQAAIQSELDARTRALTAQSAQHELLWWGQARYCHTLAIPFRRLTNADERLFYAVRDVAHPSRSRGLPVEPVAAYLVEVLDMLDPDAIHERRTLQEWCHLLASFWVAAPASPKGGSKAPPAPPSVSPKLAALVDEDPTALPVTWTRRQLERRLSIDGLGAAVGLPADAALDRAQWAAWLLREFLLDREFQAAP